MCVDLIVNILANSPDRPDFANKEKIRWEHRPPGLSQVRLHYRQISLYILSFLESGKGFMTAFYGLSLCLFRFANQSGELRRPRFQLHSPWLPRFVLSQQ